MNKRSLGLAAGVLLGVLAAAPVAAAGPDDNDCWGTVTRQRASTYHDMGTHSSGQVEPRAGLGNVARLFAELGLIEDGRVWDLGTLLASLDGLDATACP